jgi:hypothetical protein
MEPISEVGMSGTFKELFKRIRQSISTTTVRGFVDERVDEYILIFNYWKSANVEVFGVGPSFFSFILEDAAYFEINDVFASTSQTPKPSTLESYPIVDRYLNEFTSLRKPGDDLENGDTILVQYHV